MALKTFVTQVFHFFLHPHHLLLPNIYLVFHTDCSQCLYYSRLSYAARSLCLISSVEAFQPLIIVFSQNSMQVYMTVELSFQKLFVHIFIFPMRIRFLVTNRIIIIVLLSLAHSSLSGTGMLSKGMIVIGGSHLHIFQKVSSAILKPVRGRFYFPLSL